MLDKVCATTRSNHKKQAIILGAVLVFVATMGINNVRLSERGQQRQQTAASLRNARIQMQRSINVLPENRGALHRMSSKFPECRKTATTMYSSLPSLSLSNNLVSPLPQLPLMSKRYGRKSILIGSAMEASTGDQNTNEADANLEKKRVEQGEVVDQIIEMSESPELGKLLRENLQLLDQDFWMVYMGRYDAAESEAKKNDLQKIADKVMKMVEVLVAERREDETVVMQRIALVDRLVEDFLKASDKNQLKETVSSKIGMLTQDNNFWSRVAARYDSAQTEEEKARVSQMARDVQSICKNIAEKAGQTAEQAEASLQRVMAAGANENGEWFLPLNDDELERMRKVLQEEDGGSDQLVGLAMAWMKKASETSEQEVAMVVGVIQKVLHLVSAVTLETGDFKCPEDAKIPQQLTHQLLQAREERWDEILGALSAKETVAGTELLMELDDILQKVLFGLPAGSNKQKVMIEYVQEVQERVKKIFALPGNVVTKSM